MKSLSYSVNNFLHNWKDFSGAADKITSSDTQFPIQISGTHGSLFTYFLSELSTTAKFKTLQAIQYSNSSKKSTDYKRFSQDYLILVPGEYELNNRLVPATFIQILVENAIKHGLQGLGRTKRLTVNVIANDDNTIVEVTDNGRGFDIRNQSDEYKNAGTGTGLRVIQSTIDYYNKKNSNEMLFDIKNIKDADGKVCGCCTTLTIPTVINTK